MFESSTRQARRAVVRFGVVLFSATLVLSVAPARPDIEAIAASPVLTCCVVGFPLGATYPEIKALEARRAIREGAREIDMVINVGALKGGDEALVLADIRAVVESARARASVKVILETAYLSDEEKAEGCALAKAGA